MRCVENSLDTSITNSDIHTSDIKESLGDLVDYAKEIRNSWDGIIWHY